MRKKESPQQDSLPEPEQDLGPVKLEDLDQHIAERITQLRDPPASMDPPVEETPANAGAEPSPLEQQPDRFITGFEAFEVFDYASERRPESMRASYHDVSQNYQETAELMRNIHDLADLVTESIRQLNIRLNAMDERIDSVTGERAAQLDKSIGDIRIAIKEQQRLLKEANDRLSAQTAVKPSDKSMGQLLIELEKLSSFLDSRIERNSNELKHKLDEQREAIWSQVASKFNTHEKESRDYLNRSLFSLAVLVVIITFIAGALIVNTMDRVCNYLTQSVDTLRVHLDQVNTPRRSLPGQHPGGFSR